MPRALPLQVLVIRALATTAATRATAALATVALAVLTVATLTLAPAPAAAQTPPVEPVPPPATTAPEILQAPDALDDALALVGMTRADLGWTPKGWWPRWPDAPYKLRAFDALFAEPLDCIPYTRALGETAWEKLDPQKLDEQDDRGAGPLMQLVQSLGIDPKFGGFRGYSANLTAPDTRLEEAILELTRAAGRPTRFVTFGSESPYPVLAEELAKRAQVVPQRMNPIFGRLILNIADAYRWAELAFREVDAADRAVVATRTNLGEEMVDALDYCPEVDDVMRTFDEACLWYAAQKCVQALDDARLNLTKGHLGRMPEFSFDWETPWGWIRLRGGADDVIDGTDALLIVDLGGNDTYTGPVAASNALRPVSLALDFSGHDHYDSDVPAQGAGMCGVGILLEVRGNDEYRGRHYAQGAGQFGLGACIDLDGDDRYFNGFSGQGCGYFGIGLLLDARGHDEYKIWGDGQGLGGCSGVGILADRTGSDRYTAVREHTRTGRPSYHSEERDVAVSNAQGCGFGRRGDGADGHSWAGGLGALLDGEGDDTYSAGNWSMGTGYWFGIGVLHDRSGNDKYRGVAWSQGSGAHFCIGVCLDEDGNDEHLAEENSTLSLGLGHDFTVALLVDIGGNDHYRVDGSGLGHSLNRSVAMLIDVGGDDEYKGVEVPYPGYAVNNDRFRGRGGVSTYFADTSSLGLFLDVGGRDKYWTSLVDNDRVWLDPEDSTNWPDRNFSIGVDRASGIVEFTPRPVKLPAGRQP